MKLFSSLLVLSLMHVSHAASSESKTEKPNWVEQKIEDVKKAAQKKLKKKLKKLIGFSNQAYESKLDYLCYLHKCCEEGSIEAVYEACSLLGVTNIYSLDEALAAIIDQSLQESYEDDAEFVLCGKYIGDDGLEYDDGIDDSAIEEVSFYSIPLHQWEKKIIEKIVSSLAEKTLAQLLLDRKEMEKRGDQVRHVHPLRFMGHVFHEPYLKACLPQFKNSAFKWSNFIDGFVQRMREEAAKNNLERHLTGFCEYLGVDFEKVSELISKGQYEEFIYFLMDT